MIYDKADEVIKVPFESLLCRYQIGKHHKKVAILSLIELISCITNVIK